MIVFHGRLRLMRLLVQLEQYARALSDTLLNRFARVTKRRRARASFDTIVFAGRNWSNRLEKAWTVSKERKERRKEHIIVIRRSLP
jgi:hypothetical protein